MPSYARGTGEPNPTDQYGRQIDEAKNREAGANVRNRILERIEDWATKNALTEYAEGSRSTAQNRPQSYGTECLARLVNDEMCLVRKMTQYRDESGGWHRYPEGQEQVALVINPRESRDPDRPERFERVYVSLQNGDWDVWLPERSPRPELTTEGERTEAGFARRALGAAIDNRLGVRDPLHVAESGIKSISEMMETAEFDR